MHWKRGAIWEAGVVVALSIASCDRSDRDASRWLDLEIERPEIVAIQPSVETDPVADAEGLVTRVLRVPPTFFVVPRSSTAPINPFADPEPSPRRIEPPQKIFEKAGITFGPGAFAFGNPILGTLIVRQTPEQMELVDVYIGWGCGCSESDLLARIEIYELPEILALPLIRGAAPHSDHKPEHSAVSTLLREGKANLIQSATLPVRSGQRARYEDGYELSYSIPESPVEAPEPETGSIESTGQGMPRRIGTWLDMDPVLGADEMTIDVRVNLEIHNGDPTWHIIPDVERDSAPGKLHPRFHLKTLALEAILQSGEPRLIGSWRPDRETPEGHPTLYHLVFFQVFRISDHPPLLP
jgi:hypothetical protein